MGVGRGVSRRPTGGQFNVGRRGWWPVLGLSQ